VWLNVVVLIYAVLQGYAVSTAFIVEICEKKHSWLKNSISSWKSSVFDEANK